VLMDNARYEYSIAVAGQNFVITATCPNPGLDDDPSPDVWTIDDVGLLQNTVNDIFEE